MLSGTTSFSLIISPLLLPAAKSGGGTQLSLDKIDLKNISFIKKRWLAGPGYDHRRVFT